MIRKYSELLLFSTFLSRFNYLKIQDVKVGEDTFGFDRWLNQKFYRSAEWKSVRDEVIIRDNGCDLGIEDRPIGGRIYIHHMNPISKTDFVEYNYDTLLNPEYLICVSHMTHEAIHYGDEHLLMPDKFEERKPNDTIPWR